MSGDPGPYVTATVPAAELVTPVSLARDELMVKLYAAYASVPWDGLMFRLRLSSTRLFSSSKVTALSIFRSRTSKSWISRSPASLTAASMAITT